MTREPIYAALFALLAASAGFVTTSRRLKHWNDVPASEQPALFMSQRTESAEPVQSHTTAWILETDVYIYARAANGAAPGPVINPLVDAVMDALLLNDPEHLVAIDGGTVSRCWISGPLSTDEGTLGEQAVVIIPVSLLVYAERV